MRYLEGLDARTLIFMAALLAVLLVLSLLSVWLSFVFGL